MQKRHRTVDPNLRVLRRARHCRIVRRDGFIEPPFDFQQHAQVRPAGRRRWIDRDRSLDMRDARLDFPQLGQHQSHRMMRAGIVGRLGKPRAEVGNRLSRPPQPDQQLRQVTARMRVTGPRAGRRVQQRHGVIEAPLCAQREAEQQLRRHVLRCDIQ